jgi:hypothetical protein
MRCAVMCPYAWGGAWWRCRGTYYSRSVNSERAQAYGRVVKAVDDLAAAKLHRDEQDTIRHAADALLFCHDLRGDPAAEEALASVYELADHLVESDRMTRENVQRLVVDVESCGPFARRAA